MGICLTTDRICTGRSALGHGSIGALRLQFVASHQGASRFRSTTVHSAPSMAGVDDVTEVMAETMVKYEMDSTVLPTPDGSIAASASVPRRELANAMS